MSIKEIAAQYVAHVEKGQFVAMLERLYADDAESVESVAMPGEERVVAGLDALRAKSEAFDAIHEFHGQTIEGPWPHGDDRFAVRMSFDLTHLPSGHRRTMDEVAVLTVRDGKIVREEFFYAS